MKKRVLPIMATLFAMAAAEASNPYFAAERHCRQQRDDAIRRRREEDALSKAISYECRKEHEFSIHGEKITAKSRKDAIRKYNLRHRK